MLKYTSKEGTIHKNGSRWEECLMAGSMKELEVNWKQRADGTHERAEGAINELQMKGAKITTNIDNK